MVLPFRLDATSLDAPQAVRACFASRGLNIQKTTHPSRRLGPSWPGYFRKLVAPMVVSVLSVSVQVARACLAIDQLVRRLDSFRGSPDQHVCRDGTPDPAVRDRLVDLGVRIASGTTRSEIEPPARRNGSFLVYRLGASCSTIGSLRYGR